VCRDITSAPLQEERHEGLEGNQHQAPALAILVGALVLARTAASSKFSDEIPGAARKKILETLR
jgi:hypothetical protein